MPHPGGRLDRKRERYRRLSTRVRGIELVYSGRNHPGQCDLGAKASGHRSHLRKCPFWWDVLHRSLPLNLFLLSSHDLLPHQSVRRNCARKISFQKTLFSSLSIFRLTCKWTHSLILNKVIYFEPSAEVLKGLCKH